MIASMKKKVFDNKKFTSDVESHVESVIEINNSKEPTMDYESSQKPAVDVKSSEEKSLYA